MVEHQERSRSDIFGWPVLGFVFKNRYFINTVRVGAFLLFALAIYYGLVYPQKADNPFTTAIFWSLFWPFFIVLSLSTLGPVFCGICPHNFVGRYLTRYGLKKEMPGWLKNPGVALTILLIFYWAIVYVFPELHRAPWYAAALFGVLTVIAFTFYFVFKDMEYCKNTCPIGPLTKAFGKVGFTWLSTYGDSCQSCKTFDCAKACDAHLQPFNFNKNNSMGDCTLCMDCAHACEAVRFEVKKPSFSLWGEIKKMRMSDIWVFILVTAAATIAMRFHHGLGRTAIVEEFPWSKAGRWLESTFGYANSIDWVGFSAYMMAIASSLILVLGGMWVAAKILKSDYKKTLMILGYGLAPLMIVGALSHALSFFFYEYAKNLGTAYYWFFGSIHEVAPLAARNEGWVKIFGIFSYAAAIWSLWLIGARMKLIDATRARKIAAYPFAAALALFYSFLLLFTIYVFSTYGAAKQGHMHGGHGAADGGKKMFRSVDPANAVILQEGAHRHDCPNCGMSLPMFYKTNHAVTFKNGISRQFCSIHCMADAMEHGPIKDERDQIEKILVVDTATLELIDAKSAFYVIGSKKPGTMSMVSKYAFKNESRAKKFSEMFGGSVTDYEAAYQKALEDFNH